MKDDAKLGLIAGIIAVITIAVVYYHKPNSEAIRPTPTPTTAKGPSSTPVAPLASVSIPNKSNTPSVSNADLD